MLATFNKDAVYAAQAHRGICALGYMGQFPPHFELIHYAFQKAYGIDFINTKNINGSNACGSLSETMENSA